MAKNYLMKNINGDFWKRVQKMAVDQGTNVKQLILRLLKKELDKESQ